MVTSISAILICRFHLELIKRNSYLERGGMGSGQVAISDFRAAVRELEASINAEFGDHDIAPPEDSENAASVSQREWIILFLVNPPLLKVYLQVCTKVTEK